MRSMTRVHMEQNLGLTEGIKVVTDETYQMKATDFIIWANAASNTVNITLPPKAEAAGKFYVTAAIDVSNDVSILDKEAGTEVGTYGDLDTAEDAVLWFCTGREWAVVWNSIT